MPHSISGIHPLFYVSAFVGLLATTGCSSSNSDGNGTLGLGTGAAGANGALGGNGVGTGGKGSNGNGSTPGGLNVGAGVGAEAPVDGQCNPKLIGVLRDFGPEHPDFEHYNTGLAQGMVQVNLANGVPVLANASPKGKQAVTDAQSYSEWYDTKHPASKTYPFDLDGGYLQKSVDAAGRTVYESKAFFPLDGKPSMQSGFKDGNNVERNFHFTLELNTTFAYNGGEVFSFSGDDDLWVFIDGKLAVDIGGVHGVQSDSVELDTLGLTRGKEYPLSVFHAERHTSASNFKVTTSIKFTNCGIILR
ncbi:MAG: fibro-slime domain-containing protein [Polyangiaceae bacterium]|nr:fibro-slime domain-containing protein [Polyangiaceae bacterium]